MTTITIHLGQIKDGAAGKSDVASGGRTSTPTARLILYPSDCNVALKDWISCVYSSTDTESTKKVDKLTKDFKISTRGYSATAFNKWKLGSDDKSSISRLQMLVDLTPEDKPQGGESFNSFKTRVIDEFNVLMKDIEECEETSLLVAPPTTIQLIYSYLEAKEDKKDDTSGKTIDTEEFFEGEFKDICPYVVTKNGDDLECEDLECKDTEEEDGEEE